MRENPNMPAKIKQQAAAGPAFTVGR